MDSIDVQIRWLIRRDMPEVLQIERRSFETPWSDEDFLSCLRQRNCIGMVAQAMLGDSEPIAGYMIYELQKQKLHLLNFAVAPEFRRKRIGRDMINRLIDKLSQQGRKEIELMLRESNLQGQCFFRELGFKALKVVRNHYDDTDEDGYFMQYRLFQEAPLSTSRIS